MTRSSIAEPRSVSGPVLPAVIAVALLVRLLFAIQAPPRILWSDGREYEAVALSLLSHHGYGLQTLRAPGYPTFMAAVWSVLGHDLLRLRIVEALLGTLAVWGITVIGARTFGRTAGLVAGVFATLHPVLALLGATQYSENTLVVLMVGVYACAIAGLDPGRSRTGAWIAAGGLFGLAMLWRPNMVLLLPGMLLGGALALHALRRPMLLPLAGCLMVSMLVVTPWIVRNHHVQHHWYFIATGGGRALWLGSNPQIAHGPYTITFPDSALLRRIATSGDPFGYESVMRDAALDHMRSDPAGAVVLYGRKLARLFALWPETYTRTHYMNDWARWSQGIASALIFAGALLALPDLRRRRELWPLVAGTATFMLGTAVFFSVLRYRMPVEPVFIWLAGIGWAPRLEALAGRRAAFTGMMRDGARGPA